MKVMAVVPPLLRAARTELAFRRLVGCVERVDQLLLGRLAVRQHAAC